MNVDGVAMRFIHTRNETSNCACIEYFVLLDILVNTTRSAKCSGTY